MKKNVIIHAALLAAIALGLTVSCAKEANVEPQNPEEVQLIRAWVSDSPESKVALTTPDSGKGLAMAWEGGDKLAVIGSSTELFTLNSGAGTQMATFAGTEVSGDSFTILYPGDLYDTVEEINARSYTDQVQIGNGNTDHLEWNAKIAGVTDYTTLQFYDNENLSQNGALKFHLQLPADFTKVYSVSLSAPSAIFSIDNGDSDKVSELTLTLKDDASTDGITLGSDKILTAYMMVSWNENAIEAGTELTIKAQGDQQEPWTKVKTVGEGGFTIAGGKVTSLKLNNSDWDEPLFWGGSGTQDEPYIIKSVYHMQNMNNLINSHAGASKLWFKLGADIDMAGVNWQYKNNDADHNYPIDFNGDGHNIANFAMTKYSASLFGALVGCVHDVNFTDAVITTASGSSGGLLAYRGGRKTSTMDAPLDIYNVNVVGLTVTGGTAAVGGLVGRFGNGSMTNCHITGLELTATGARVGGLAGEIYEKDCSFTNCSVEGSVSASGSGVGGLIGYQSTGDYVNGYSYSGCSFDGTVSGEYAVGGLIGGNTAADAVSFTIDGCSSTGSVEATSHGSCFTTDASFAGGLVGIARHNTAVDGIVITASWSSANITGNYGVVGGLVGESVGVTIGAKSAGVIDSSKACEYKNGTITGGSGSNEAGSVGGLAALTRGSYQTKIYGGKVTNAKISGTKCVGGVIGQNNKMNLEVEGCTVDEDTEISSTGNNIGGILGNQNASTSTLSNDTSLATISGNQNVGGILGLDNNIIIINDCTANVTITATDVNAGGIIGNVDSGKTATVTGCSVDAAITAKQQLAGIIGRSQGTFTITSCKSAGTYKTSSALAANGNGYVGGIVGIAGNGTIKKSYSTASITGANTQCRLGGLVGCAYYETSNLYIDQCYFAGSMTKVGERCGGILGDIHAGTASSPKNHAYITNTYFSGSFTDTAGGYSGGMVGVVYGFLHMENCYASGSVKVGTQGSNRQGGIFAGLRDANYAKISKCLAWHSVIDFSAIKSTLTDGAIVGWMNANAENSFTDCYRRSDLDYRVHADYNSGNGHVFTDAKDATITSGAHFDGKASEYSTCSAQADALGWGSVTDADSKLVWDLTDDYPILKNVVQ